MIQEEEENYLGEPLFSVHLQDVQAEVFCAKKYNKPKWKNSYIKDLVKLSRRSYLVYGDVPLEDAYDGKSSIYIVRGKVFNRGELVRTDFLSARFIFVGGKPLLSEDLNHTTVDGEPIANLIKKKLYSNEEDFLDTIVTMSRIAMHTENKKAGSANSKLLQTRWTALYIAMISASFHEEVKLDNKRIRFITGMFRPELLSKAMSISHGSKEVALDFKLAHDLLSVPRESFSIGRELFAYKYPAYFLDLRSLYSFLKGQIEQGTITKQTFQHFLGNDDLFYFLSSIHDKHTEKDLIHRFKGIDKLLTHDGPLPFAKISGKDLRQIANEQVEDGPVLTITPYVDFEQSTDVFLTEVQSDPSLKRKDTNFEKKVDYEGYIPQAVCI